ncbi:MAG: hypothetical protein FP827_05110 [Candidatus Omnitrophica bacterium]|nr:hypothetical protein [Candidatus Omnitrophota bacterium]
MAKEIKIHLTVPDNVGEIKAEVKKNAKAVLAKVGIAALHLSKVVEKASKKLKEYGEQINQETRKWE